MPSSTVMIWKGGLGYCLILACGMVGSDEKKIGEKREIESTVRERIN